MPKKKDKGSMTPKKRNMKRSKNDDSDPEIDDISENEEYTVVYYFLYPPKLTPVLGN